MKSKTTVSNSNSTNSSRALPSDDSQAFWGFRIIEELLSDIRFGFRQAFKNKLHSSIIIITLALCLGSNTTAYNFLKRLVTNPYEYGDIDGIVQVGKEWAKVHKGVSQISVPHYFFFKKQCSSFSEIGFVNDEVQFDLDLGNRVRRICTDKITSEIWSVTQVRPIAGRLFTKEDVENTSGYVIVLGERLWNDLRSEDNDLIGEEITLDGQKYKVLGVVPKSFYLSYQRSDAWVPRIFAPWEKEDNHRHNHSFLAIARLKPGVSVEQADQNLKGVYEAFLDIHPSDRDNQERTGATFSAVGINKAVIQNLPQIAIAFRSVQVVTLIVLVIGCLNVSGMIMVRSFSRIQEYAMRRALGASIRRLSAQIFTEIIIYFVLGGFFSLFILQAGFMCTSFLNLDQIPWASDFTVDVASLKITFAVAFLCALITGAIPVISVLRRNLMEYVKSGGRSVSGSVAKHRMHAFFVITQVTLSVVLLVLAGVLILNMKAVLHKNIGFSTGGRIAFEVQQPAYRFGDGWENYKANIIPFQDKVVEKLRSFPGVISASASNRVPISPYNTGHSNVTMNHYEYAPGEEYANALRVIITPGYFDTVGTKLLRGRDFQETDNSDSEPVIIISQNMVERYYKDLDPLGQTIELWGVDRKIIGVAEKVQDKPFFMNWKGYTLYFPFKQFQHAGHSDFIVHVSGNLDQWSKQLKQAILEVDPKLTMEIHTFDEMFELATFAQQVPMVMTLFFASIALLLSGIGLYGLISFTVIERTKEYGIRMALGANPVTILKRILKGSGKLIAWGLGIGVLVSVALCVQINPILSDINTTQPALFIVVTLFVACICMLASFIPALAATRINVIDTLRYE
jgi:predicted permease